MSRAASLVQSPIFRVTILSLLGLGISYKFAVHRGVIPSVNLALQTPITCPPDDRLHEITTNFNSPNQPISQLLPQNFDRQKISVLIEKSQYRLTLHYNQKPIKSYPVVFGRAQGDKQREGDLKTPEGILRIQDKYPHPNWSKFLWLDYPTAQSQCKHDRAKQQRKISPTSTVGSEVGIHGVPQNGDWMIKGQKNWTLGCPALTTQAINELYEVVEKGTIVEILA